MKTLLIIFLICVIPTSAFPSQQYNSYENRFETVPDDWEVQYNPYENDFSYQPEDAEIEYNPFKNSFEWDSGHNLGGGRDE